MQAIRLSTPSEIEALSSCIIPSEKLPTNYLAGLSADDRTIARRACLLAWAVTAGTQVPREIQLKATLATRNGKDSMVNAGTGSGKTLPIALNLLLDDPNERGITLTISPLKRLQITQENDFNIKYGIPTMAVNDDTPREEEFYNEHVFDIRNKTPGSKRHIIATVEQLFKSPEGHLPRLGVLVRNQHFQKKLKRIYVDEAHCIHVDGLPHYGSKAFRPAWALLDVLKTVLLDTIPWQAMSATFPSHILKTVSEKILRPGYVYIHVTSNRPNTLYATHRVITSIEKVENYECFLTLPFTPAAQPRVLIFFDNKTLTREVKQHLDSKLPHEFRNRGIVQHYHGDMSDNYLSKAHFDFTAIDGCCKILCATSGESVGVDFPDVKIVCNAGLPSNTVDTLQRGGRVGRREGDKGLYVIFHEPWLDDISLDDYTYGDLNDPDRPRKQLKLNSQRSDRAPYSSAELVKCASCIRKFFARYLGDESSTALDFTTEFCCGHDDPSFRLQDFLPGLLFTAITIPTAIKRKARPKYRPVKERLELDTRIIAWLRDCHHNDALRGSRSMYDILSHKQRTTLVRAPRTSMTSPEAVTSLLNESKEWGVEWSLSLFKLLEAYDADLMASKAPIRKKNLVPQKKRRLDTLLNCTS
ncbi:P-loop containing nucleoside triphosphate hydrolase protein [Lyophyllum atratum]|nr:P-loop containing nucleoside triphosphate hydrolase protein [Lyophyllum atratum]